MMPRWPVSSERIKQLGLFFGKHVLVPLLTLIAGLVFGDPIKNWWVGPAQYKVYLIGPSDAQTNKLFSDFQDQFQLKPLSIDRVGLTVEIRDDEGKVDQAKIWARKISEQPDTLVVIGHVLSQQTKAALPIYFGEEPPIPVIATTETDTALLADLPDQNRKIPFFQMSPPDDVQAQAMVDYAVTHKKKEWAIVAEEDQTNRAYSDAMTNRLKDLIRRRQDDGEPPLVYEAKDVNFSVMDSRKVDMIAFVGRWQAGCNFVRAYRVWLSGRPLDPTRESPTIILSDSAWDPEVFSKHESALLGVLISYQLGGEEVGADGNAFGTDAARILRGLVIAASRDVEESGYSWRKLLGMHRVADARRALASAMWKAEAKSTSYQGRFSTYEFTAAHQRKNSVFHVWQLCQVSENGCMSGAKDIDPGEQRIPPSGCLPSSLGCLPSSNSQGRLVSEYGGSVGPGR
jgi:hypothetical protein